MTKTQTTKELIEESQTLLDDVSAQNAQSMEAVNASLEQVEADLAELGKIEKELEDDAGAIVNRLTEAVAESFKEIASY